MALTAAEVQQELRTLKALLANTEVPQSFQNNAARQGHRVDALRELLYVNATLTQVLDSGTIPELESLRPTAASTNEAARSQYAQLSEASKRLQV
jgi:hypothetical protein